MEDPKGRGLLFREVCRVLRARQCPLFLLENVPGLAETDEGKALKAIKEELTACNYDVVLRTLNAKAFTAQSRKRIFFIGFRQDLGLAKPAIEIPDFPDLNLRARDIFEPEEELNASLLQAYTLSEEHFRKLQGCKKWSRRGGMTDTFAWGDKVCSTLVGHYGTSISRGNSQLVPRPAPHLPRRFSPRECARPKPLVSAYVELFRWVLRAVKERNLFGFCRCLVHKTCTLSASFGHICVQHEAALS